MQCQLACFPPGFFCNPLNKSCYPAPPGQGEPMKDCMTDCGKPPPPVSFNPSTQKFYTCNDTDLMCYLATEGTSYSFCKQVCGNASNTTPVNLIGDYRGLQVNKGYKKGEWTMLIVQGQVVIKDPTGAIWASGSMATYNGELWLVTSRGTYRGIDNQQQLPEVLAFTWALGTPGGPAPDTFDDAMVSGSVFTFFKCLNPGICQWVLSNAEAKRDQTAVSHKRSGHEDDPCSKYPDCQSCIAALDYCGWCSVNVLYNATTPGTQCAGLNRTKIPGFLCAGTFSTVDCPTPPTPVSKAPSQKPPAPLPSIRPSAPQVKPPPTQPPILWTCNPQTTTCYQNATGSGGMPFDQCNLTCNIIPNVPIVLRNRTFRGLDIEKGYLKGEYTAKFSPTSVIFTDPAFVSLTAIVSQTGQYMILNLQNGQKIFTLWQLASGSVVDFLSWSWGAPGGAAPTSFDSSMTTPGQKSFVFDACSPLSGRSCNFGQ